MHEKLKLSKEDQKRLSRASSLAKELDGPDSGDTLDELEAQELAWLLSWLVKLVNKGYDND